MTRMNYHNKFFRSASNTDNGEVSNETTFHYRQEADDIIWATYQGGAIRFGTLSGYISSNGELFFHYQHQNTKGEFMTGKCHSIPEQLPDGRIRLLEKWQWTSGDLSTGESVIEEFLP